MKIRVLLKAEGIKEYPQHPNYALSCAIYKYMTLGNKELADFIHDKGYESEGRFLKPFCFNRPQFRDIKSAIEQGSKKRIFVSGYSNWLISSPLDDIMLAIIEGMAKSKILEINHNQFNIENIDTEPEMDINSGDTFYSETPIIVPLANPSGRPVYLNPLEKQFFYQLSDNARRKLKLITNQEYELKFCMPNPEKFTLKKATKPCRYMDSLLEGYIIPLRITGNSEAIKKLVDCGLGAYNCQGFGMVKKLVS